MRKSYTRDTVAGWVRVFRTMTRDAMVALSLTRDPTLRVVLPEADADDDESNALMLTELAAFLEAMKHDFVFAQSPQTRIAEGPARWIWYPRSPVATQHPSNVTLMEYRRGHIT